MVERPSPRAVTHVRIPGRAWLLATVLALTVSLGGSVLLTRAIDNGNQERFDITLDVFESVIRDQIDGYRIVSFGLPALLGASDDGRSVDFVGQYVGDRMAGAALIGALPVEGFAGVGLLDFGAGSEEPQPVMLPSLRNLDDSVLLIPEVSTVAKAAHETRRNVLSEPIDLPGGTVYAYAVPTTGEVVVVELLDPEVLVSKAGVRNGVRAVEAVAKDVETGQIVGSTDSVPADADPNSALEASLFGRELLIEVYPGAGFDWERSWLPGVSLGALWFLIAGLIYVVGVVNRRRMIEQGERLALARQVNEDKDRFIAAVSHELRTPLTSVVGLADELTDSLSEFGVDQIHELIGIMAQESHEMSLLVEDLLVAARLEEGVVEPCPEVVRVQDQITMVVAGLGAGGSSVEVEPTDATAWADPLRLRQVIRNLVTNALRHGGPSVRIRVRSDATTTVVEVSDDGAPVPADARSRMFEPYYRSAVSRGQAPSVGLGLSVSHGLARLMDGALSYTYESGWSVFRLDLPAATRRQDAPAEVVVGD